MMFDVDFIDEDESLKFFLKHIKKKVTISYIYRFDSIIWNKYKRLLIELFNLKDDNEFEELYSIFMSNLTRDIKLFGLDFQTNFNANIERVLYNMSYEIESKRYTIDVSLLYSIKFKVIIEKYFRMFETDMNELLKYKVECVYGLLDKPIIPGLYVIKNIGNFLHIVKV